MKDPLDRGRPTIPEGFETAQLPRESAEGSEQPVLVVLTGAQVGQRIRLEEPALIGRDPEADLMLADDEVEWHHARLEPRGERWVLVDLRSAPGAEVRGDILLTPDDQVVIGRTVLRFEVHDPVEQAYDEAVLERLNKDELTGLLARRRFDIELGSALAAAARKGERVALVLLDIDGLKRINDRLGHLAGARMIADVGAIVGATTGQRGMASRLGGDEFGVFLPGHDLDAAVGVADELRCAVAAHELELEDELVSVRLSGGVAVYPDHGGSALALLRAADEALYRAKREGGDRVARPRAPADRG